MFLMTKMSLVFPNNVFRGTTRVLEFCRFYNYFTHSSTNLQEFFDIFYIYNYFLILMYFSTNYNKNTNKSTGINTLGNE